MAWAVTPLSASLWARASIAGVDNVAVYGKFTNPGEMPVAIVSVSSPIAKSAMIHKTRVKHGMASMVPMTSLRVPAHQSVECKPGKCHIMLMGVNRPLKVGDSFALTLGLAGGGSVTTEVKVGSIAQMTAP